MPAGRPAGQYDERITILAPPSEQQQSASGEPANDDRPLYTRIPAAVTVVGGDKRQTARQVVAEVSVVFAVRTRPLLSPRCRVEWRGQTYYVRFVEDDRGPEIALHCAGAGE